MRQTESLPHVVPLSLEPYRLTTVCTDFIQTEQYVQQKDLFKLHENISIKLYFNHRHGLTVKWMFVYGAQSGINNAPDARSHLLTNFC